MNDTYAYDDVNRILDGPAGSNYQYDPTHPFAPTEITTSGGVDTYCLLTGQRSLLLVA